MRYIQDTRALVKCHPPAGRLRFHLPCSDGDSDAAGVAGIAIKDSEAA